MASRHTKRALESLHPNISVFRYPTHIENAQDILSSARSIFESVGAGYAADVDHISDRTLQTLFGMVGGPTLLWAHHEKLVIVDQHVAFLGGIDLSYGRWDPVQHPIADAHCDNGDQIIFPGQDYNNGRVMDFKDVAHWERNELLRRDTSRMGWEDISLSVTGPVLVDICQYFVDRWNFIHRRKYNSGLPCLRRYKPLPPPKPYIRRADEPAGSMSCQLVCSVSHWSHGTLTEHSIYNAYLDIIDKSEHFVYIEQQFFITATDQSPGPIWNRVGDALVARIVRAAREQKRYKVVVVLPAVPAFAGDLQSPIAGKPPRALMKLQYDSISRAEFSVFEKLQKQGISPDEYISFFNLRSYDRINMATPEKPDNVVSVFGFQIPIPQFRARDSRPRNGNWDSVSSCYMFGDDDIRNVPWPDASVPDINAFVSEELYVHSKLLIADDKVVVCASANLNDRSLKGSRDSEMGLVVEGGEVLATTMHGQPFQASKFAATLRRYLYRKHLGLLIPQDMRKPDGHFMPAPVPDDYDHGSKEDQLVADPLSDEFLQYWNDVAHTNTAAFKKVFAPVPDDSVKSWLEYDELFWKRFIGPDGFDFGQWGHVQKSNFSDGDEGVTQVQEELSKIRGTLVEMPLQFLVNSNIQIEDLGYDIITRQGYV